MFHWTTSNGPRATRSAGSRPLNTSAAVTGTGRSGRIVSRGSPGVAALPVDGAHPDLHRHGEVVEPHRDDVVPEVEAPAHRLTDEDRVEGLLQVGREVAGRGERDPVGEHDEGYAALDHVGERGDPRVVVVVVAAGVLAQVEHDPVEVGGASSRRNVAVEGSSWISVSRTWSASPCHRDHCTSSSGAAVGHVAPLREPELTEPAGPRHEVFVRRRPRRPPHGSRLRRPPSA